jgi:hypothetical protein
MDHQKGVRVAYRNGIQDFQSVGQSETQKLSSAQLLFCPEGEFSSEVNIRKSVTSKMFSVQSHMNNG